MVVFTGAVITAIIIGISGVFAKFVLGLWIIEKLGVAIVIIVSIFFITYILRMMRPRKYLGV